MTAPPLPHDGVPTMHCAECDTDVPAGAFCGLCGAHLSPHHGDGRGVLRPGAYVAAPGEHVLRLSVVSSLFPHLPHRSRTPFRVALAVLFLALVAFALLGWQAPLIAVSALGCRCCSCFICTSPTSTTICRSARFADRSAGCRIRRRLGTADRRHRC